MVQRIRGRAVGMASARGRRWKVEDEERFSGDFLRLSVLSRMGYGFAVAPRLLHCAELLLSSHGRPRHIITRFLLLCCSTHGEPVMAFQSSCNTSLLRTFSFHGGYIHSDEIDEVYEMDGFYEWDMGERTLLLLLAVSVAISCRGSRDTRVYRWGWRACNA